MKNLLLFALTLCLLLSACAPATLTPSPAPSATRTPLPPTPILPTETPLPPTVNPEYLSLQTMLDGQKAPYSIVDGQIEVGGHQIIANDLGLIIFADQTGIQTWNQEKNSWQVLNFSDESTFTGLLKENWDKLGADIKSGASYDTIPEYQKKLDQEIKFIRRQFMLNQTEWLAANADIIKFWSKGSAPELGNQRTQLLYPELSDQQIQWLYFKYNIENKQISLVSPSELRVGVKTEEAPMAYFDINGKYHNGTYSTWGINDSDPNDDYKIWLKYFSINWPPFDLDILGVKTRITRAFDGTSTGNQMALAIIPGIPPDQGIFLFNYFNPSPNNNGKPGIEIRLVNFIKIPSTLTVVTNRIVPVDFEIPVAYDGPPKYRLITLPDLLANLGRRIYCSARSIEGVRVIDPMFGTPTSISVNTPFDLGIQGAQHIIISEDDIGATIPIWPWDFPR